MQRRTISTLIILLCSCTSMLVSSHEVIMHDPKSNQGHDQIHVDPPQVTYDDELNQLTVYFGSTGNITLEYLDGRIHHSKLLKSASRLLHHHNTQHLRLHLYRKLLSFLTGADN